jgi:hypothetical protein
MEWRAPSGFTVDFAARRLSPGGCADLLASALLVDAVQAAGGMSLAVLCPGQGAQHPGMLTDCRDDRARPRSSAPPCRRSARILARGLRSATLFAERLTRSR